MYKTTKLSTIELDKLFLPTNKIISKISPISFGEVFLDLLIKECPMDIAIIALDSLIFRQCLKDKIINFLLENLTKSSEENLCLTLYLFDSNKLIDAYNCLCQINENILKKILFENYKILFDYSVDGKITGFSDFCEYFIKSFENVFIHVILNLLCNTNVISLTLIIKYLSCVFTSSSGEFTTNLFQTLLESYFREFFKSNENLRSDDKIGMQILMRTYLGTWKNMENEIERNVKSDQNKIHSQTDYIEECQLLYGLDIIQLEKRYRYLNLMKPFSKYSATDDNKQDDEDSIKKHKINLFKIQSLLSSSILPIEILDEILLFTKHNINLSGVDSILSLILPISTTVDYLIKSSPQTILAFGIDRFVTDDDWISLNNKFNKKLTEFNDKNSVEYLNHLGFFKGMSLMP